MRARWRCWPLPIVLVVFAACAPAPEAPENLAPVAVVAATPAVGPAPLLVEFSSSGSFDPDGSLVGLTWDFGDGSSVDGGQFVTHSYVDPGTYVATLTVTDDDGASGVASIDVNVVARATLASQVPIDLQSVGDPFATYGSGGWDSERIREPGAVIHDPRTGQWICVYSGRDEYAHARIGAVVSPDGATWSAHPDNPLTGDILGEDPYLAKNADGTLFRDGAGRALMFTEEKIATAHRGIEMWRSAPDELTGWTLADRVVDRGDAGDWNETLSASPVVVHDGTRLVMLFEGMNLPAEQYGEVGIAFSVDDGETWTVAPAPIIERGGTGRWNEEAVIPDDVMLVDGTWVLLAHGQVDGSSFVIGRYSSTGGPAEWDAESFSEMVGNPLTTSTDTVMNWGNDPAQVMQVSGDGRTLERMVVTPRP